MTIPYDQAYEAGFEDMPRRVPDISKIREFVGYAPTVHLDEIIMNVVKYWKAEQRAAEIASKPTSDASRALASSVA